VLARYSRVTFNPAPAGRPGSAGRPGKAGSRAGDTGRAAELIGLGHSLVDAVTDAILRRLRDTLHGGTVLIDPDDPGAVPRLLAIVSEVIVDGHQPPEVVSRRINVVELRPDGSAVAPGPTAYLRYRRVADPGAVGNLIAVAGAVRGQADEGTWLEPSAEDVALRWAVQHLSPTHLEEVTARARASVGRTCRLVEERLSAEIAHWRSWRSEEPPRSRHSAGAAREHRLSVAGAHRRAEELQHRLERRLRELNASAALVQRTPVVEGVALVLPAGLAVPPPEVPRADTAPRMSLPPASVSSGPRPVRRRWGRS
jgi:hypothetical protein